MCQSNDHFLACGELRDPAHDALHSVHPHFQLHGLHPEALIPPHHKGVIIVFYCPSLSEKRNYSTQWKVLHGFAFQTNSLDTCKTKTLKLYSVLSLSSSTVFLGSAELFSIFQLIALVSQLFGFPLISVVSNHSRQLCTCPALNSRQTKLANDFTTSTYTYYNMDGKN